MLRSIQPSISKPSLSLDFDISGNVQVTAILYANPSWCPADGGKLRLWPPRTADPALASAPAGVASQQHCTSCPDEGFHVAAVRYQHFIALVAKVEFCSHCKSQSLDRLPASWAPL